MIALRGHESHLICILAIPFANVCGVMITSTSKIALSYVRSKVKLKDRFALGDIYWNCIICTLFLVSVVCESDTLPRLRWRQWLHCTWIRITLHVNLTLNVRGPSYLGLTRSISWILMPWLLTSPGHQQPWYWLCRICKSWSYLWKDFKYLCPINVE